MENKEKPTDKLNTTTESKYNKYKFDQKVMSKNDTQKSYPGNKANQTLSVNVCLYDEKSKYHRRISNNTALHKNTKYSNKCIIPSERAASVKQSKPIKTNLTYGGEELICPDKLTTPVQQLLSNFYNTEYTETDKSNQHNITYNEINIPSNSIIIDDANDKKGKYIHRPNIFNSK